jgi:hypothetical protein
MNKLSDDEVKALLQTLPDDYSAGAFFSDPRFKLGRISFEQTGEVYQPHVSLNDYEQVLAQTKRVWPLTLT